MEVLGSAGSAKSCYELIHKETCDILLLDVEMETTDAGIILAEKVKVEFPEIKIIFLSVHEADDFILKVMDSGACDYIVKGCSEEELLSHIRAAYIGKPLMQQRVQLTMRDAYERLKKSERSLLFFINNVSTLTPAEKELLSLLLQDKKLAEIAQIRVVEISTIKTQVKSLLHKFACKRTKEIVELIRELGLSHLFNK